MQLKPFKELIALSKEKLDEAMAPVRAGLVQSKAKLKMAELDNAILEKQTKVQESLAHKDVNFDNLMDQLDEVELLERRKDQYADILAQLFPETAGK